MVSKRLYLLYFLLLPLGIAAQSNEDFHSDLTTEKKPWTHLNFQNDPDNFQFAIVTDRTGGPRPGVFEDAVEKLNWMMPEFVISVGDLIRGAQGKDSLKLAKQWGAHFERIAPLKMPFFHLAGNHDIKANNEFQVKYWNRLFGAPYYSFTYKDVLFICLFTNEGTQVLSDTQVEYFKKILEENEEVRWTMVFMHHPLWRYPHMSNFSKIEESLENRSYTVFAGHQHKYHHTNRNKNNYYVLATTGGGSELLGNSFGTFDHVTWVSMTDRGPSIANLRLDGILPHDVANDRTEKLLSDLLRGTKIQTEVFVGKGDFFEKGRAYLKCVNKADLPLYLEGGLFHNHQVVAYPKEISIEIAPQSEQWIELDLKAIKAFPLDEQVKLDFQGTLGFKNSDYPDLSLPINLGIPIRNSNYPLLPIKEVEFVEEYKVELKNTIPNSQVYYSLNGEEPGPESEIYTGPITISEQRELKARLIMDTGYMSDVQHMILRPVTAGKGLVVEHYGYDPYYIYGIRIPDYRQLTPYKISVEEELDPRKIAGRDQLFGLVYKGEIELKETGIYTLKAISDDSFRMFINGKEVLADPIKHKARETEAKVNLEAGKYPIEIHYFQHKKKYALDINLIKPSGVEEKLSSKILSYGKESY
ncbi:MAG: chitobiase/beta-hexosaminidase C-terminal domain-containing protein [Bacteroidota bacterium]